MKVIGNLTKDAIIRAAVSEGINVTQEIGTGVVFESATTQQQTVVYDSTNQKIVIGYRDQGNNNYGTAVVATVSGSSISYGTPTVFHSATTGELSGAFDSNSGKVVFSFEGGKSVVGTVSGTSISFGSVVTFDSSGAEYTSTTFDSANNKIVVFYRGDPSGNRYGTAIVGTVSGTSISFGSAVAFNNANTPFLACSFDSNAGKVVAAYKDVGNSNYGTAIVGTVSGTSISFGSETVFNAGNCGDISTVFDSTNNKIVIAFTDDANSNYGTAIVGTVSGTSISFGSEVVYNAASTSYNSATFDSSAGRVLISYSNPANSDKGEAVVGTVSGTSISFGDMALFKDGTVSYVASAYDSNQGRVVIAYRNSSNYGEAVVFKVGYSQATGGTIADGAPVIINANGTMSSVSQSAVSQALGSAQVFESAATSNHNAAYDSHNQRVVLAYRDGGNSNRGTAIVGTVNANNTITYGTAVVFETGSTDFINVLFDSTNNKIVIIFRDVGDSNKAKGIVGTVDPSDNSISFGSASSGFASSTVDELSATYTTGGKVVAVYRDTHNSNYGNANVGTVSGTSITFGSSDYFEGAAVDKTSVGYDTANDKVLIFYVDAGNSDYPTAIVGTVSGTTLSYGTPVVVQSNGANISVAQAYDTDQQKFGLFYKAQSEGKAAVATISGTSVSVSLKTPLAAFENNAPRYISAVYHQASKKIVVAYEDDGDSFKGKIALPQISGTNMLDPDGTMPSSGGQGSPVIFDTSSLTEKLDVVYDSVNKKAIIAYSDGGNSEHGTSVVFVPAHDASNLTSENFIGIMNGPTLDTKSGEVLSSCNVARNQTSLTPGQTYFVTGAGALSLTAGSPSVTAGTAISSTELIVKG